MLLERRVQLLLASMPSSQVLALRLLLLSLIAISVSLFWLRFRKVVNRIRRARPETDFKLQPIGRRIGDFFWEVLCQAKVIRERPLPGLAHAFVFWAFCAFALVTINHLAAGFGVPFLSYESSNQAHRPLSGPCARCYFGAFYFWFAFAFAVCCA